MKKIAPSPITQERLLAALRELLLTNEVPDHYLSDQDAGYAARAHARSLLDQAEREAS